MRWTTDKLARCLEVYQYSFYNRIFRHPFMIQAYTCVEMFAGQAAVSKAFRMAGHPTASLDLDMGPSEPVHGGINAYDLTTTAGMGLLGSELEACS